jgi:uncharacterized repeat protein (TIGR03803 family)
MHRKMLLAIPCWCAILFALASAGQAQTESVIYTFTGGSGGSSPYGSLVADTSGNLYGTAENGGAKGFGVVFELSPNGSGGWNQTVVHSFVGSDGVLPWSGLVWDSNGNLYGTSSAGGAYGYGTVYEVSPAAGGVWTAQALYSFKGGQDASSLFVDGALSIDKAGNLYGASNAGGAYNYGAVFEVSPGANGVWTERILHSFTGNDDGGYPQNQKLAIDPAGNLYGVAGVGGLYDYGLVYELEPGTNGAWTEKIVHSFAGGTDGTLGGSVILDSAGNLYGESSYAVFELTRGSNGVWTEKQLHRFTGASDGAYPEGPLTFDGKGNLYGVTLSGGAHRGTVFELSPGADGAWTETILHDFAQSGKDGKTPNYGGLVVDSAGDVYGTTSGGGTAGWGVVYVVKP